MLLLEGDKFSSSAREGGGKPLSWPWGGGRCLEVTPMGRCLEASRCTSRGRTNIFPFFALKQGKTPLFISPGAGFLSEESASPLAGEWLWGTGGGGGSAPGARRLRWHGPAKGRAVLGTGCDPAELGMLQGAVGGCQIVLWVSIGMSTGASIGTSIGVSIGASIGVPVGTSTRARCQPRSPSPSPSLPWQTR